MDSIRRLELTYAPELDSLAASYADLKTLQTTLHSSLNLSLFEKIKLRADNYKLISKLTKKDMTIKKLRLTHLH